ncbi:MAG: AarF/UbiB family protein [Actinomycetota bacterium]
MQRKINKRARTLAFTRVYAGIVWDFWREARLARKIGLTGAEQRMSKRHRRRAIQFRETATRLGGVLIKLGQFVGSRVDVMPEPYIQELMKLQDEVPPEDYSAVKERIEAEFGRPLEEVYPVFNPVSQAAASLAQAHEAELTTGEKVIVKVQRPGIEDLIDIDLATFTYLMEGVRRFTKAGDRFDIEGLVDEFQRVLGEELDFLREADNAERFAVDFRDDQRVLVPKVYHDYSTGRIVTLERIQGTKINDYDGLTAAGIDRKELARTLVDIYVKQFLETGFFHADPHPGNLFVNPGPAITFLDFGMMGEITAENRESFIEALFAIVQKDADGVIEAATDLNFIRQGANTVPIRNALEWMFQRYSGMSTMKAMDAGSLETIEEDIRLILRENPFTLPVHFAYVGKAFGTLVGVIAGLDPDFDIIEEARPYVEKLTKSVRTQFFVKQAKKIGLALLKLPTDLSRVIDKAERGELKVKMSGIDELMDAINRLEKSKRATVLAILAGSLTIAAAALYVNSYPTEALLAALGAAAFAGAAITSGRRRPRFHP